MFAPVQVFVCETGQVVPLTMLLCVALEAMVTTLRGRNQIIGELL